MGEAKRRQQFDKTFGQVRRHPKKPDFDIHELEQFQRFMDLPRTEFNNSENAELIENGFELLYRMSKGAGVELPPLPEDEDERKRIFQNLKEDMAKLGGNFP
ncbi:hypothetical protein [Crocosphaera sp. XPORK-15E]|uniref:hypothetical protein n=1 Tax=Crocosphaera sp. XPORK-15E TaxID=3110247 RepID=UPI002B211726|nr:hypothetical protein [Crocosphaera sp. XPORK-15E]MEA5537061.1 hypothetical protein [Crocosphaera sp. XPORK-15E]